MDRRRTWLDAPVRKFAKTTLSERHRKQLKRGHNLAELEIPQRHRARSAAKLLRYTTEFFASLNSEEAVQHYLAALARCQDDLGRRNDVVVADGLLTALSLERPDTIAGAPMPKVTWRQVLLPTMTRCGNYGSTFAGYRHRIDRRRPNPDLSLHSEIP
jgi:CHAD domain-containing protein